MHCHGVEMYRSFKTLVIRESVVLCGQASPFQRLTALTSTTFYMSVRWHFTHYNDDDDDDDDDNVLILFSCVILCPSTLQTNSHSSLVLTL